MAIGTITSETRISGEGIKKHFKSTDPVQALYELVWNGFDACASEIDVHQLRNELGGVEHIWVQDNGEGIRFNTPEANFGLFNDSEKKLDVAQHGSHGRGRLAFHRLSHQAQWYTRHGGKDALISIDDSDIRRFSVREQDAGRYVTSDSGTTVVLSRPHNDLPDHVELLVAFSQTFGWYLALHSNRRLRVDGAVVPIPAHELRVELLQVEGAAFEVKIIRWIDKPNDEKSYVYLIDSTGRTVYRQLSSLNNKKDFHLSVYVASTWADTFAETVDLLNPTANTRASRTWTELEKRVTSITRAIYEEFLRGEAEKKVAQFEEEGYFPTYAGLEPPEATWRLANTKELVKNIYIADPALF